MGRSDFFEVTILAYDRKAVLYGCRGNQGVGQLDRAVNAGRLAIGDKARPCCHHGLADRDWVSRAGEDKRVGATG